MDDFIRILLEIILEVSAVGAKSTRVPMAIRYIFLGIIISFSLSIMIFFLYLSASMDSIIIVRFLFLGVVLLIGVFVFRLIKEIVKRK